MTEHRPERTEEVPGTQEPSEIDGVVIRPAGEQLTAAVLSVGREILLGDITDTNATWLSGRLRGAGIDVRHHHAAADDLDELVEVVRWLSRQVHVIVVGGGLGPTSDDLTRDAVARAAGLELHHHDDLEEAIRQRFADLGRPSMPSANLRQARIPAGAMPLQPIGTAPGFALTMPETDDVGATRVYALPGVPWELKEMFVGDVEPEVGVLAGGHATVTRVVHAVGKGESDIAAEVEPRLAGRDDVELSFLARGQEVQVRIMITADDADAAREASQPVLEEVIGALGPAVAGIDDEELEDTVLRLLGDAGQTVATAESATAGDIAARLGKVPGASHGLVGGVAVYATEAKQDLLGVAPEVLEKHGPVAEETTRELARGAKERFGADWGIGVTGVVGPGKKNDLEVGTVFWALAHPDGEVEVHGRQVPGDRELVIARLGSAALDLLRRRLQED
jgi:nicotinamide-nucleotide amidase